MSDEGDDTSSEMIEALQQKLIVLQNDLDHCKADLREAQKEVNQRDGDIRSYQEEVAVMRERAVHRAEEIARLQRVVAVVLDLGLPNFFPYPYRGTDFTFDATVDEINNVAGLGSLGR